MVTGCLEDMSIWTQADMRTVDQSAKGRWYSGERDTPRMADAIGLDEEGRIRKAHAKTGCVYAWNPEYHLRKTSSQSPLSTRVRISNNRGSRDKKPPLLRMLLVNPHPFPC